jgi:hypothetical protein
MRTCEYLVLTINADHKCGWHYCVVQLNGQDIYEVDSRIKNEQYPVLWSYLNVLGEQGWEITSTLPDAGHSHRYHIILKRSMG